MEVVLYPHSVLATKAMSVTEFGTTLVALSEDMFKVMYEKEGIGLAAPQVGMCLALCVIDVSNTRDKPKAYANPRVRLYSVDEVTSNEGCLSIPGAYCDRPRHKEIEVEYQDMAGVLRTERMTGLLAIAMQHEVDHLNGKLYIDCYGPVRRRMLLDKYRKHVKMLSRGR